MTNAEHAAAVWHRDGRQAAAECLSACSLGDVDVFRGDCRELAKLLEPPAADPVIESARWAFASQWGRDPEAAQ